jgi:hypothetical protein
MPLRFAVCAKMPSRGNAPALRGGASITAAQCGLLLLALAGFALLARAQTIPYPDSVRSVEVLRAELVAYVAADEHAPRRGTIMLGAHVPVVARVLGAGCGDGSFVQIGAQAFVCERDVHPSSDAPDAPPDLAQAPIDLPHEYLQTTHEDTRAYAGLDDYGSDEYATVFGKGFAVAVAKRVQHEGVAFVRTASGYYLPERELKPVPKSEFGGVELDGAAALAHVGWVAHDGAEVRDRPGGVVLRRAVRLERLELAAELADGSLTLQDGGCIDARAVLRPELQPPPPELGASERWIDVDAERQLLVAYDGTRPVFATVISSGRANPHPRTPRGVFRISIKLRDSDMHDSEHSAGEQSYAIERVPWVQFFDAGQALHAAFWHDRLGEAHGRGGVELSPRDASTLFQFTRPELPPGWSAIRPTEADPSTALRVR